MISIDNLFGNGTFRQQILSENSIIFNDDAYLTGVQKRERVCPSRNALSRDAANLRTSPPTFRRVRLLPTSTAPLILHPAAALAAFIAACYSLCLDMLESFLLPLTVSSRIL